MVEHGVTFAWVTKLLIAYQIASAIARLHSLDLCHLYERATKIVSRPAHLYYAHLAAALGPYYDAAFKERDGEWDLQSTSSHGSNSSGGSARRELHPNMRSRVYYA